MLFLYLILPFVVSDMMEDPFAGLSFNEDCETMKKKNPEKKIDCSKNESDDIFK